jgi:VanZ family protein
MKRLIHRGVSWISSHKLLCISLLLCAAVVVFIFSNSLEDGKESHISSGRFVRLLKPILDPHDRISPTDFSYFVRKLAHFTEFFWLGMALCGVIRGVYRPCADGRTDSLSHPPIAAAVLFALITAVTDEWIQSYTGRTSSVRDVILDFCGAVCGLLLTALAWHGIDCIQRRIRTGKTEQGKN